MPEADAFFTGNEVNAVDGAGLYTEVAPCALVGNDGMHDLGGAEYGIDRAGLNAFRTAYAFIFADPSHYGFFLYAVLSVKRLRLDVQQVRQRLNGLFTTGWALVDGIAIGDRLRIGSAPRITTLATLGLGQYRIDLIADRVALNPESNGGKAQQRTEYGAESQQRAECSQKWLIAEQGQHQINPEKPIKAREASPAVIMPMAAP